MSSNEIIQYSFASTATTLGQKVLAFLHLIWHLYLHYTPKSFVDSSPQNRLCRSHVTEHRLQMEPKMWGHEEVFRAGRKFQGRGDCMGTIAINRS